MSKKKAVKLPEGVRLLPSGRFQARYPVTIDGVTRQIPCGTFGTATEARDARTLELAKLRSGGWVDPKDDAMSVKAWATMWLEVRPSTNRTLRSHLNSHILPTWGTTRLRDVTTLGLQHWVNGMVAEGLAPATVRDYYATFKQMLGQAVVYGKLSASPCVDRAVKLPKMGERDIVPVSVEEMGLLELAAPLRFRAMVHLAAWGGLRWGELAALRWEDVDLEASVVHVRRAKKHDGTWGPPKNGKTRTVTIGPVTVEVLREHRRDFGATELLFTTTRQSRPLSYANFRKHVWLPLVEQVGLEPAPDFHDLRHGHATEMVRRGMDWKVLSERLGHHKPSFTMDVYGTRRADAHEVTLAILERVAS